MRKIESIETGSNDKPIVDVTISDSGELQVEEPYAEDN